LICHPDTAPKSKTNSATEFQKLSEAWRVLSKPTLRKRYDDLRKQYLNPSVSYNVNVYAYNNQSTDMQPSGFFNAQQNNYLYVTKKSKASVFEYEDKYRSEKWRKMPLSKKKVFYIFIYIYQISF
jgi:curved DNA-binding protein CbpA